MSSISSVFSPGGVAGAVDPVLDLVLEREVPVAPDKVWAAWTTPALLTQWFTPAPWTTALAELDLRPGGHFRTVMRGPEGEEHDSTGCILEVVPGRRLVWTDALGPGFRPTGAAFMTGVLELSPTATGTLYRAIARHASPETAKQHAEMGFLQGWGAALDQLVALMGDPA